MEDRKVINFVSKLSIFFRLFLILLFLIFRYWGGFRPDQTIELFRVIAPMTVLYLTVFIVRLVQKPFPIPRFVVSDHLAHFIKAPAALFYVLQLFGTCLAAILPNILSFDELTWLLFLTEIFFAAYAATAISYLFRSGGNFPQ